MRSIDSMIVDGVLLKKEIKAKIQIQLNLTRNDKLVECAQMLLKSYKLVNINIRASLHRYESNEQIVDMVEEMIEDYIELSNTVEMLFTLRGR